MRDAFFPPGDTRWKRLDRDPSTWRELSLALHLIRQTVNPGLLLADCLAEWNRIAADLAEPPRHRKHQLDTLYEFVQY
jgi:hypothetical protein